MQRELSQRGRDERPGSGRSRCARKEDWRKLIMGVLLWLYCSHCLIDSDELHSRLQAEILFADSLSSTWTTERKKSRGHTTSYYTWIIWMVRFHQTVIHHQPNPRAKRASISWHGRRVDLISLAKRYTIALALWFLHPSNLLHKTKVQLHVKSFQPWETT